MNALLSKRLLRDLKANAGRYAALMLMIILGVYIVVSIVGSAETVIRGTESMKSKNLVEDGQFTLFLPFSDAERNAVASEVKTLEETFSFDLKDSGGVVERIFQTRKNIDRIMLDNGALPVRDGEAVIEKNHAKALGLSVGDTVTIEGVTFRITGLCTVPDYDQMLRTFGSPAVDSDTFGLLFVTAEYYKELRNIFPQKTESYTYAYHLGSETDESLRESLKEMKGSQLLSFTTYADNIRIEGAAGDVIMDKRVGLVAGVIVLMLFAYVISVFVVHQIEREQSVIGALYSLGVKKHNLLLHYLTLPTLVSLVGGLIGLGVAFSPLGVSVMIQSTYDYFSTPVYDTVYPVYLILYGALLPPLLCLLVNLLAVNRKLSKTALSLLRNEQAEGSYRQFKLNLKSFPLLFAVRQFLREIRSSLALLLGMFITFMVVALGINTYVLCSSVRDRNREDTTYECLYLYKFPDKTPPEGGEAAYIRTLTIDCLGYTLDVSAIGIDGNSRYYDAVPKKSETEAVINCSLAERFGYQVGDTLELKDPSDEKVYHFTVSGICNNAVGFSVFLDNESMCSLFGMPEHYWNAVYSDRSLDIPEELLYSVTTKDDIVKSSGVFVDAMRPLMITLISAGSFIFAVVLYLMLAVIIDRSTTGISMIKVFGYRPKEIRKLYLNANTITVLLMQFPLFPLAKKVIDTIYPNFIANVACSMRLSYSWSLYLLIFCSVTVIYFAVNAMLLRKINRVSPAEILKNRE
ncbi:MAG: FtsX-like permease family protein [Lachnospiraceae bacterium]|nr:FtsX-like permease family protein [Lachnospiraceae bacterium]